MIFIKKSSPNNSGHDNDRDLLYPFLSDDSSKQTSSLKQVYAVVNDMKIAGSDSSSVVLDLGCGSGRSFEMLTAKDPSLRWIGIDLVSSPEVDSRSGIKLPLVAYDGVNIPLLDACIDIIYTHQVFEHVRNPSDLLAEARRVLKPRGFIIGSTSHLEPYHSRSLWNYTPFGFAGLLDGAGFEAVSVRPGIDCMTLITRRLMGFTKLRILDWAFEHESPLNASIELLGRLLRLDVKRRSALKLLFAGHFVFMARKKAV